MEWRRLDNTSELLGFRDMLADKFHINPLNVIWGPAPQEYPCMIVYLRTTPETFVPVVVYRVDAAHLLQVGLNDGPRMPATRPAPAAHPELTPSSEPTPAEYYRSVVAHLMTMATWMRDVGCYKDYERDFIQNLAAVDQYTAEDHAKIMAGKIFDLRIAG